MKKKTEGVTLICVNICALIIIINLKKINHKNLLRQSFYFKIKQMHCLYIYFVSDD